MHRCKLSLLFLPIWHSFNYFSFILNLALNEGPNVVDLHRFVTDSDPILHYDADPDSDPT
jgi:hypothetical protein